jgi:hypothetical protein
LNKYFLFSLIPLLFHHPQPHRYPHICGQQFLTLISQLLINLWPPRTMSVVSIIGLMAAEQTAIAGDDYCVGATSEAVRGRVKGLAEGQAKGLAEGEAIGMEKGKMEALIEIVCSALRNNMPVKQIQLLTGLPEEKIQELTKS